MPRPLHLALPLATLLAGGPPAVMAQTTAVPSGQPTATAAAPSAGIRDLSLGREAVSRQDYAAAIPALRRAVAALDPQGDRAAFADAWLHLGIAYLLGPQGLDAPEQALAAFLASAAAAPNPASAYLWAGTAAERLGRRDEAEVYKARALAGPAAPPAAPPPAREAAAAAPEVEVAPAAAAAVPEPAPAPATPTPAPQPQPAPAEPAPSEGTAFRHFFRGREPSPVPPSTQTRDAPAAETTDRNPPPPASGDEPDEPKANSAQPPAEPTAGAAFDHFFRRRRAPAQEASAEQDPAAAESEPEEAEKPPAV
jgi:hypothetical protein